MENERGFAPETIAVVGASGGIGSAFVSGMAKRYPNATIYAFSRSGSIDRTSGNIIPGILDYARPKTVEIAASFVKDRLDLVVVATGSLHGKDFGPEKSLRDLDADRLARSFLVNTIGPALVARHFLPKMNRKGRSVFAALSARVGSISDNRLGGWYGYRSAKSALNQILRTASIEHARKFRNSAIIGLHPGTVDTALSRPFQANVAESKLFSPEDAAERLLDVIENIEPADTGKIYAWDGSEVPA